jgi:hypothetical protein
MALFSLPASRHRREYRFFGLGAVLAAIPICATFPSDRLLIFVGIGAMGLVAGLFESIPESSDHIAAKVWRAGVVILAGVWLVLHVLIAPLLLPGRVLAPSQQDLFMARVSDSLSGDAAVTSQQLVIVNAPEMTSHYLLLRRASLGEPLPGRIRFLSTGVGEVLVGREDEYTLSLAWKDGLFAQPLDQIFRGSRFPFSVGDSFRLTGLTIEVRELTDDGRPARASYRFSVPLEDPGLRWLKWAGREYESFEPPSIGDTITLPPIDLFDAFKNE